MDMLEIMGKALMEVSPDRTRTRFPPFQRPLFPLLYQFLSLCLDISNHDHGIDLEALRADERFPLARAFHLSRTSRSS